MLQQIDAERLKSLHPPPLEEYVTLLKAPTKGSK